jgi:hypothetical protein
MVGSVVLQGIQALDADQPGPYSTVQYSILPGPYSVWKFFLYFFFLFLIVVEKILCRVM